MVWAALTFKERVLLFGCFGICLNFYLFDTYSETIFVVLSQLEILYVCLYACLCALLLFF